MALEGKTALVTGGGSGIGRAVAEALADAGCRVAIAGRREERLRATVEQYARRSDGDDRRRPACHRDGASAGAAIVQRPCDVADRDQVRNLVQWAHGKLGRIDVLVSNAGINVRQRRLAELSPEDWDRMIAVNLTGAFNLLHEVLPIMRRQRDGLVVQVSSIAGKRASVLGGAGYSAAKFGMTALGLCVGLEEAEHGIRCTNIYPGEVDTPILEDRPEPVSDAHRARILKPEDVAAAVVFVASLPPRAAVPELVIKPATQPWA